MKNPFVKYWSLIMLITVVMLLAGCSTFSVKPPPGIFLSTGDYVSDVETMGILQAKKTKWAFLFIYDLNKIRSDLYEELLDKVKRVNADGVTNVQFYWKISPLTYASLFIFSGIFDFYIEGVAIKKK
jgi:hypothetical protein